MHLLILPFIQQIFFEYLLSARSIIGIIDTQRKETKSFLRKVYRQGGDFNMQINR